METVLILVHLMIVVALVVVILLQRSEGGALGIGGGGGGLVSARGAADAMTKTTAVLAAVFFSTSIILGVLAQGSGRTEGVLDNVPGRAPVESGVPTTDGPGSGSGGILGDIQGGSQFLPGPAEETPATPAPSGVPATE